MDQGELIIGYDQFMPQPFKDRLKIFNEISAENRALLVKTHVERWRLKREAAMSSNRQKNEMREI